MTARRRIATLLACALALLVAAGCGGDEEQPSTTAGAQDVEAVDEVGIADFDFAPPTITVDAGTEITWSNEDPAAHTASAEDGSFDTGTLDRGDEGKATLEQPGTYAYVCEFHPFMKGTIEVK